MPIEVLLTSLDLPFSVRTLLVQLLSAVVDCTCRLKPIPGHDSASMRTITTVTAILLFGEIQESFT